MFSAIKQIIQQLPWQPKYTLPFILWAIAIGGVSIYAFIYKVDLGLTQQAIDNHQYELMLTGHLVHSNVNHLLLNLAGLLGIWALHGHYYSLKNLSLYCLIAIFSLSTVMLIQASYSHYVGFSAVLHSLIAVGAILDIKHKERGGILLLLGLIAKVSHEQFYGSDSSIETLIGTNVAIDAHLYGVIIGTVIGGSVWLRAAIAKK